MQSDTYPQVFNAKLVKNAWLTNNVYHLQAWYICEDHMYTCRRGDNNVYQ